MTEMPHRIVSGCVAALFCFAACGQLIGLGDAEEIRPDAGTAGSAGNDGSAGCWPGQKTCDGTCSNVGDPNTGCSATACEPCITPHAISTCSNDKCAVESCLPGYADCDLNGAVPGCEVDTQNDPHDCGGCTSLGSGEDCSLYGPGWICVAGQCKLGECNPATWGNCDGDPTNGCETDLEFDVDNCGACKNVCSFPNAFAACAPDAAAIGSCEIVGCESGWENCNGEILDGCEINTLNDSGNCGYCNNGCTAPANAVAFCDTGSCSFQCSSPYTDCAGACVALGNDPNNCGSCGNTCPQPAGGTATCGSGQCGFICGFPLTKCGGECIDTNTNVANCGGCGVVCTAPIGGSVACVGGTCQKSCPSGQTICNNQCVDTQINNAHCGGCNSPCSNERICQAGQCKCPATTPIACTTTCEPECCPSASCSPPFGGVCQSTGYCGCAAPLSACSGVCVNKSTDLQNCGSCGTQCTNAHGITQCSSGACKPTCSGSWASCDGNPNNGCETSLATAANCGACGWVCPAPQNCCSGLCGSC